MPPVGFEATFSAGERSQTYALDRAATGTFNNTLYIYVKRYDEKLICSDILHARRICERWSPYRVLESRQIKENSISIKTIIFACFLYECETWSST
jgi:hypothetical protein